MSNIDSILHRIRSAMAKRGRKSKISIETGIRPSELSAVMKPTWDPKASTIRRLDAAVTKLFPGDQPAPPHQPE